MGQKVSLKKKSGRGVRLGTGGGEGKEGLRDGPRQVGAKN